MTYLVRTCRHLSALGLAGLVMFFSIGCSKVTQGFDEFVNPGDKNPSDGSGDGTDGTDNGSNEPLPVVQPQFEITPSPLDFGTQALASNTDLSLSLKNIGSVRAINLSWALQGTGFTEQSTDCGSSLDVQASCTITFRFSPIANAAYSASLGVIATNGGMGQILLKGVGGTGPASPVPVLAATPTSLSFDTLSVGSFKDLTLSVQNTGGSTANSFDVGVVGRGYTLQSTTCGASLAVMATCTLSVRFSPPGSGNWNGSISLTALDATTTNVALTGKGEGGSPAFSFTPSTWAFSTLNVGSFEEKTFTITNEGSAAASSPVPTSMGAGFAVQSHTCSGQTLNIGQSCQVTVRYTPPSAGSYSGFLSVAAGGSDMALASLTGSANSVATPTGALELSSQTISFPSTNTGSNSTQTVTVENTGGATVNGLNVSVSGTGFSIQSTTCGATLAASATCDVVVKFMPTSGGTHGGYLTASGTSVSQVLASLSGTGVSTSSLTLTPSSHDFGSVVVGQTRVVSLILQNTGGTLSGNLTISSLNTTNFPIQSTDCPTNLAAAGSCQILVEFTPSAGSLYSSQVQVAEASAPTLVAGVNGQGTVPALSITPSTWSYGTVLVGGQGTKTFTITNTSSVAASGFNATVIGSAFSLGTNNCSAFSTSFPAGQTCTVDVKFLPDSSTSFTGFLVASASGRDSVYSNLSGTGGAAANLGLSPASHAFGTVFTTVGDSFDFTLSNTGGVTATSVSVMLSDTTNYTVTDGCGATVAGSASCTLTVNYDPVNESTHPLTMTVSYFNGAVSKSINVTTTGTGRYPPALALDITDYDFGSITVGNIIRKRFTLSNTGQGYASSVVITTTDPSFAIAATSCGTTIAASASCTIDLEFAPNHLDTFTAKKLQVAYAEKTALSAADLESTLAGYSSNGRAWTYQSMANPYRQIAFTDTNNGYAVASNGHMKVTDDGGLTWRARGSGLPGYDQIYGFGFIDTLKMFITTSNNNLWASTNGGYAWQPISGGTAGYTVYNLECIKNGTYCGAGSSSGSYFETNDSGANWGQSGSSRIYSTVEDSSVPSVTDIYTVGSDVLMKSVDQGGWFELLVGNRPSVAIAKMSTTSALAGGGYTRLRKSTDSGDSWQNTPFAGRQNNSEEIYSVDCVDANVCWLGTNQNRIHKTTDGGATWAFQKDIGTAVNDIEAIDNLTAYAVGYNTIYKTVDGGTTWTAQTIPGYTGYTMNRISCLDANNCTIAYSSSDSGGIFQTTNGGTYWEQTAFEHWSGQISTVANKVFMTGDYGWLRRSTDGGLTWRSLRLPLNRAFYASYFVTDGSGGTVGWVGSDDGHIYKSADDGATWTDQTPNIAPSPGTRALDHIFFLNSTTGWAVGNSGLVLRTTDGGANWAWISLPDAAGTDINGYRNRNYRNVYFTDANNGWIVAGYFYDGTRYVSTILRTTDGGVTWAPGTTPFNYSGATGDISGYESAYFINSTTGFAYPHYSDDGSGSIIKSTDGGATWTNVSFGSNSDTCSYGEMLFAQDGQHGWIGGCGAMYRTTDGGTTWASITVPTFPYSQHSNTDSFQISGLAIVSQGTGPSYNDIVLVAATRYGAVLRSTDSGANWTQTNLGDMAGLRDVNFESSGASGWISFINHERFLHTTDFGATWSVQNYNSGSNCYPGDLSAFNANDVISASNNCSEVILSSSDGGANWTRLALPQPPASSGFGRCITTLNDSTGTAVAAFNDGSIWRATGFGNTVGEWSRETAEPVRSLRGVDFVDASHGWAVGDSGQIIVTSDAGATWAEQGSGVTSENLRSVNFFDTSNGVAVGTNKAILTTTTGGATWTAQLASLSTYRTWHFRDVYMNTASTASATTDNGGIARMASNGVWSDVTATPPPNQTIEKIRAMDRQTIYAVTSGSGSEGAHFLKSLDGGQTWNNIRVDATTTDPLYNLAFADKNTGWIVGGNGRIYKSANAGASWTQQVSGVGQYLWGLAISSATRAWAVGDTGRIVTTSDGASWTAQTIAGNPNFKAVATVPGTTIAWAVGDSGALYKTTDGSTWNQLTSPTTNHLRGVYFIDANTGWIVGSSATIYKTVNGGSSWTSQTVNINPAIGSGLNDIYAFDVNNVWIGGDSYMLYTTNSGGAWQSVNLSSEIQWGASIKGISFSDLYNGWMSTTNGVILRTFSGAKTP